MTRCVWQKLLSQLFLLPFFMCHRRGKKKCFDEVSFDLEKHIEIENLLPKVIYYVRVTANTTCKGQRVIVKITFIINKKDVKSFRTTKLYWFDAASELLYILELVVLLLRLCHTNNSLEFPFPMQLEQTVDSSLQF